ncbi:type III effector HrpK domain-containing protein [Pseudomonas sp. SDO528_S397]
MTAIPNGLDPAEKTGTDGSRKKFETALFTAVDRPAFDPSTIRGPSIPLPYQNVQAPVNNTITYTPLGSDKPVTLKQIDNPRLFEQLVDQYNSQQNDASFEKNLADSKSAGYTEADASTVAPGLGNYKFISSTTELGPGLMRYETFSGEKIVVSQKETPQLFAQVSGDSTKIFAINASQAEGYRLAGPDETFDPSAAIGPPEEVGPGLIRYTAASGDKVIVSQDETPALYDQIVKLQAGAAGAPGAVDTSWIDNASFGVSGAKDWDTITGNTSGTPTKEELDLNRPRAAAQLLSQNWDAWGLHGAPIDFANPPSTLPPEAQAVLKFVASSPNFGAALDTGGRGKADRVITHADVDHFISNTNSDLGAASKSYGSFLGNNPGDLAKANAKSAAILMANESLVAGAGPAMLPGATNQRSNDGMFRADNLQALGSDSALSSELTGAAAMWSKPGMFRALETGGDNPATGKSDGIGTRDNIGAWLEKQAPKSDSDTLTFLDSAATRDAVAGVDTSGLTADVLANPQNYTGEQKAAVLVQLTDAQTRLLVSDYVPNEGLMDKYTSPNWGLNPNEDKIKAQLQSAIETLSADPDVQGFLQNNRGPALADIVDSDPTIKVAMQNYNGNDIESGKNLTDNLNAKDANGKPIDMGVGLQNAANDATIVNLALGGNGHVDLTALADKAGQSDAIQQYYKNELVTGKAFTDAVAGGMDPTVAANSFAASTASAQAFLGDKASADDAATLQVNFNEALGDTLLGSASTDTLNVTLGDGNGNFDEAKVTAAINDAAQKDPEMFVTADGGKIDPAQVVSMLRSVWDIGRQGDKIADALPKAIEGMKFGDVSPAFKQGLLHIGSAVLMSGVLIARSASGSTTPVADANRVSAGLQFTGLLLEGGTKYAKEAGYGVTWVNRPDGGTIGDFPGKIPVGKGPLSPQQIANIGVAGKVIGSAGGIIGGVLGVISGVDSLKKGDYLTGSFSVATGVLGTGAAVAGLVEAGAGLYGASEVGAVAGTLSGILGGAAAILGGIGSAFLPFALADAHGKAQDAFYGQLAPILKQYGLTGGPEMPGDYPADPIPPINT